MTRGVDWMGQPGPVIHSHWTGDAGQDCALQIFLVPLSNLHSPLARLLLPLLEHVVALRGSCERLFCHKFVSAVVLCLLILINLSVRRKNSTTNAVLTWNTRVGTQHW